MAAAIHFKFASFKEKQTIAFDGFNMSVKDVKQEIMERLKLKSSHDNLILTNSQTAKAYTDDSSLIQKNTTLLVRRVPKNSSVKKEKIYVVYKAESNKATVPRTYKAIKGSTLKPGNLDSGKTVSTLKVSVSWFSHPSVAALFNIVLTASFILTLFLWFLFYLNY